MEATRLSNTKGLSVPLDYASTILARVEAERDSLRAENAKLRELLQFGLDRLVPAHADRNPAEQQFAVEAHAALAGSR